MALELLGSWCETLLSDDGEFELRSLPPEVYSVKVIAPGYELDPSRLRYQAIGPSEFGLRLGRTTVGRDQSGQAWFLV